MVGDLALVGCWNERVAGEIVRDLKTQEVLNCCDGHQPFPKLVMKSRVRKASSVLSGARQSRDTMKCASADPGCAGRRGSP
jgi:hypothetical protein